MESELADNTERFEALAAKAKERLDKLERVRELEDLLREKTELMEEFLEKCEATLDEEVYYGTNEEKIGTEVKKIEVINAISQCKYDNLWYGRVLKKVETESGKV